MEDWPNIENCGLHNPEGIHKDGSKKKMGRRPTHEGEWPHTCVILHKNKEIIIGEASLIAPKVLLTAAHLFE